MATKTIRNNLYATMRAAIEGNMGFIYNGFDNEPGPQAYPRKTLLMLARRGWTRTLYTTIPDENGQAHRVIVGGWITARGRYALRQEILRRGDAMPARLARPGDPTTAPVAPVTEVVAALVARPTTPARRPASQPAARPAATAVLDRPPTITITREVDPFALVATGGPAPLPIPF